MLKGWHGAPTALPGMRREALQRLARLQAHPPCPCNGIPLPLQCLSGGSGACLQSCAALTAALGYVLPTLGLRCVEQRSRALFASSLRAAAAHAD